jgi:hypothetical protein
MKLCILCGEQPAKAYRSYCRECDRRRRNEYRAAEPEKHRRHQRDYDARHAGHTKHHEAAEAAAKYGITRSEAARLRLLPCEACGLPGPSVIDHTDTGSYRGVLCHRCNIALGWIYDDPDRCDQLARYLRDKVSAPGAFGPVAPPRPGG